VTGTTSRVINQLFLKRGRINRGALTNILVDSAIAISFIVCSGSGLYFLFGGEGHGAIATPEFLFDRQTWDFIHAWSGVMFIVSAVVHLMIHWTWVPKVSRKIFLRKTFREFGEI
jgi:membrane protein implicated in regulation of membrane protease activity